MHYIVIGKDGKDSGAQDRRMAARPDHLQKMKDLKAEGHFIFAGALLDDNGDKMVGSAIVMEFDSENDLQSWLSTEPYINGKVWEHYEVIKFKIAQI